MDRTDGPKRLRKDFFLLEVSCPEGNDVLLVLPVCELVDLKLSAGSTHQ